MPASLKSRFLRDSEVGMATGNREDDVPSLQQVLASDGMLALGLGSGHMVRALYF